MAKRPRDYTDDEDDSPVSVDGGDAQDFEEQIRYGDFSERSENTLFTCVRACALSKGRQKQPKTKPRKKKRKRPSPRDCDTPRPCVICNYACPRHAASVESTVFSCIVEPFVFLWCPALCVVFAPPQSHLLSTCAILIC